jgi:putative hydrolase of the HAD superfamily
MSLLYGGLPAEAHEALVQELVLDRKVLHFDSVALVTPGDDQSDWQYPGRWQTLFRIHLDEAAPAASPRAVLFDFGGVLAEEGFREGLRAITRAQGREPERVHRMAMDAVYDSGYLTGQGGEEEFWALLGKRTGIHGEVTQLSGEILRRFVLRPLVLEAVRALRRAGLLTAILSD